MYISDHQSYTLDPTSRYPTINLHSVLPFQVRNLFDTDEPSHAQEAMNSQQVLDPNDDLPKKRKRRGMVDEFSIIALLTNLSCK